MYNVTIFICGVVVYAVRMDIDFLGVEYGLTVLQGAAPVYEWELLRGEVAMDVAGVTFAGEVAGVGEVAVEHVAGERGVLRLRLPRFDAVGEFGYEVWYVAEDGERYRLVYGVVGVVECCELLAELEGLEVSHTRLALRMPERVGGHVQLVWKAVQGGAAAAREAVEAAEQAVQAARGAVDALEAAQAFMASFNDAVQEAVRVDEAGVLVLGNYWTGVRVTGRDGVTPHIGQNGNWWSGDVDLGMPSRGADGLTPHISADGFWCLGEYKTEVRALGRDGINGSAVRRVLVDSVAELPVEGERCNGGFFYYVPNAGGEYDVYAWLERRDTAGWVRVHEAYDIATAEVYGLSKLGTDVVAEQGAPVAVNGAGNMTVPVASVSDFGSFRASSSLVEKFGGGGIYVSNGQAWVNMATTNKPGCVIYSAFSKTPDNYAVGPNSSGWIDVVTAAADQRGVVFAAADISDDRDGAMVSARQVREYMSKNYCRFGDVMSQAEVYSFVSNRLASYYTKGQTLSADEVQAYVDGRLAGCATAEEVQARVDEALVGYDSREVADGRYVQCAGVRGMEVVTLEELPAPAQQQKGVLYIAVL